MKEDFAMLDENDDASLHTIIKPKTMDNNCVNLQCLNNRQKLIELKDKYDSLEKKYFQLEKTESDKCFFLFYILKNFVFFWNNRRILRKINYFPLINWFKFTCYF